MLAKELHEKLITVPEQAFDVRGDAVEDYDDVDQFTLSKRNDSCMHPMTASSMIMLANNKSSHNKNKLSAKGSKNTSFNYYEAEMEIRKHSDLFKHKLNDENLDTLLEELMKHSSA